MSVDEYTQEFEKPLIKCDINEPEEQTVVRYLDGLEPKYANVIELQQYTTFDKVCVLAHKVEQQRKKNPYRRDYPKPPRPIPKPTPHATQTHPNPNPISAITKFKLGKETNGKQPLRQKEAYLNGWLSHLGYQMPSVLS